MENEIGGETEMEKRTRGQRKGKRRKAKKKKKQRCETEQGQRVSPPFDYLLQFPKFTQEPLEKQGQSR